MSDGFGTVANWHPWQEHRSINVTPVPRAVVCAPGPSLLKANLPDGVPIIGVNGAVIVVRCDWWAFCDEQCLNDFNSERYGRFPIGGVPKLMRKVPAMRIEDKPLAKAFRYCASLGLAIATAWHLGATRIEVYGADFAGQTNEGAYAFGQNPRLDKQGYVTPQDRWERTRGLFNNLAENLLHERTPYDGDHPIHPCELVRIMPDET